MRQKSPELDIPEGSFYKDIPGFNVYVKKKDPKDGLLKDVMIYDYSEGFNNARVIVADSGRLKTSADKLFLVLSLFNGESFENVGKSQATMEGWRRGRGVAGVLVDVSGALVVLVVAGICLFARAQLG